MAKYLVGGALALVAVVTIVVALALIGGAASDDGSDTGPIDDASGSPETTASAPQCTARGVLPDPVCTPGAIDPSVTQDNLQATICTSGYTKTVRPPASYTNKLKSQQIAAYGYEDTNPRDYEEDHLISLELGGSPRDPANLWPEKGASPNPKDKVENQLHSLVCSGKMMLADAQRRIATDWTTAVP